MNEAGRNAVNEPASRPDAPPPEPRQGRVLIFAPTGNDANLTAGFLQQAGLDPFVCANMRELTSKIKEGCGALVLAEEALEPHATSELVSQLSTQPSWSDVPVSIITSGSQLSQARLQRLDIFNRNTNISLLERPFRPATLVRMVEVALRTRARQYQVRDLLVELRGNEARIRRILEQTAIGIAELDLEGRFTLVNDQFCAVAGRSREELLQLQIRDITYPDDIVASSERRELLLSGRATSRVIEKRYVRPDGKPVWVQDHLSAIRDLNGALCGIAVASADITDRKLAEHAAERARDEAIAAARAKDEFLAALSHELRTPLNPVLLLASEGSSNAEYPPAARADFETITRNVSLEARLFDDLLDLTRITRGKLSLDRQPQDLHACLRDALGTVEEDIRQRWITLKPDFADESPIVFGDVVRLQQVFWNVLKNAVKFTPSGGTITVSTHLTENQRAIVVITDTGIGMSASELTRIFDTFAQGDHAADHGAHRFGGLGLGLAISKTLIEMHGGTITASSEGRDKGSTFTIEFPLAPPVAPETTRAVAPERTTNSPFAPTRTTTRVLVVEDHEPTRIALTRLLTRRKFDVRTAGSVNEALQIASTGRIDFVLSDIGLPDGTGYDLMRELGIVHGLRGIALTGYGQEQDIALSYAAGFVAHLTKPVDVRSLDKILAELNTTPTQNAPRSEHSMDSGRHHVIN